MRKILILLLVIVFFAVPVSAEEIYQDYDQKIDNIVSEYDVDFDKVKQQPFENMWQIIKNTSVKAVSKPMAVFYKILAVLIITALINFFSFEGSKQIARFINIISVLAVFYGVFEYFSVMAKEISDAMFNIKNFMMSFIPIFAGVSFASGEFSSSVYTGFFLVAITAVADFCVMYILPSINLFLTVGVTAEVSSVVNLRPFCSLYTKMVKVTMTAAVSVLCFVLSLQTALSNGKDGLVLKAGKLFITSAVPIIGSGLESAVGSIYAGMGILKGFCGIAGITVVLSIFVPHIAILCINWFLCQMLIVLSSFFENSSAEGILNCFKEIIEILLSICVLFLVLLIFSLTVMIKATGVG